MAQRSCEVCDDPLPIGATGSICDECQKGIDIEVGLIEEESECETTTESGSASAEGPSSSATPIETTPEPIPAGSTSRNSAASSAADGSELDDLDFGTPVRKTNWVDDAVNPAAATAQILEGLPASPALPEVVEAISEAIESTKKPEEPTACESCGFIQKVLKSFKGPVAKEPMLLCDKCFADEVALVNPQPDAAMQGKIVHPDEAEREEILSMDDEDRVLYNEEVLINASTPLEHVYARVELLERRLHRAKLQLKASKRTLTMRVENLDKKRKDEEYRKMGERLAAKKRARAQGDASGNAPKAKKTSPVSRRSKADQFRDSMKANGFSEAWIEEQVKKMGLEG